ncbi:MAG TPA: NAD(P)-dependent oxidoreductase [Devosiaceae bacterium]|jgi:nucleoside-diphosphate-sugar epimerase
MATIAITGAAGAVGSAIRPIMSKHTVSLTDRVALPTPLAANESFSQFEIGERQNLAALFKGADLVVHLAGIIESRPLPELIETNVLGVHAVFEAALSAGVHRVLYASTNHVVGFTPTVEATTTGSLLARPDGTYGASKAMGEAIASLYADYHGLTAVSARILTFLPKPKAMRHLATWLSPQDFVRLIEAVSILDRPGHHVLWGISRNTRRWASLVEGEAIGYHPQDDAETHAAEVQSGDADADARSLAWVGGRQPPRIAF